MRPMWGRRKTDESPDSEKSSVESLKALIDENYDLSKKSEYSQLMMEILPCTPDESLDFAVKNNIPLHFLIHSKFVDEERVYVRINEIMNSLPKHTDGPVIPSMTPQYSLQTTENFSDNSEEPSEHSEEDETSTELPESTKKILEEYNQSLEESKVHETSSETSVEVVEAPVYKFFVISQNSEMYAKAHAILHVEGRVEVQQISVVKEMAQVLRDDPTQGAFIVTKWIDEKFQKSLEDVVKYLQDNPNTNLKIGYWGQHPILPSVEIISLDWALKVLGVSSEEIENFRVSKTPSEITQEIIPDNSSESPEEFSEESGGNLHETHEGSEDISESTDEGSEQYVDPIVEVLGATLTPEEFPEKSQGDPIVPPPTGSMSSESTNIDAAKLLLEKMELSERLASVTQELLEARSELRKAKEEATQKFIDSQSRVSSLQTRLREESISNQRLKEQYQELDQGWRIKYDKLREEHQNSVEKYENTFNKLVESSEREARLTAQMLSLESQLQTLNDQLNSLRLEYQAVVEEKASQESLQAEPKIFEPFDVSPYPCQAIYFKVYRTPNHFRSFLDALTIHLSGKGKTQTLIIASPDSVYSRYLETLADEGWFLLAHDDEDLNKYLERSAAECQYLMVLDFTSQQTEYLRGAGLVQVNVVDRDSDRELYGIRGHLLSSEKDSIVDLEDKEKLRRISNKMILRKYYSDLIKAWIG